MEDMSRRILELMEQKELSYRDLSDITGIPKSALQRYATGTTPKIPYNRIVIIAKALGTTTEYITTGCNPQEYDLPSPIVTNKVVAFPVIGEIAAGFDKIGMEDWTGDTIEIPEAVLHGHDRSDFFVLRVSGDSMYPHYQEGDYVLVLKQDTLNYSGEVGAILYDDELVSLKKIEYVEGEDWLRLVPINPNHPPKRIEGEALAHCRIIGIPRLLIRKL